MPARNGGCEAAIAPGESVHAARFEIERPDLWWPAGAGAQTLYPLEVVCGGDVVRRRIGLRRLELLTDPDEAGARFAFRVNGRELFCRGANWIPADALPSRATPELTRKLLVAAADANMNMIRVWGGGFYEQDFFYDICDELGLLVWQDFMFACNLYPSTPDFLAEVRAEVDYQVRRLGSHASIALWCGDNELIGALNWFEESRRNRDRYLVNYDRLNRTIEEAMRAADPERDLVAVEPVARNTLLRRRLARRFLRRHALLERLARGQGFRALSRRAAALLLRIRLPVVPVERGDPQLRHRRRRSQHRVAGHGVAPEERRRQCADRRDHAALLPLSAGSSRISCI